MTNTPGNGTRRTILQLSWEYPPHIVGGLARHVQALSMELGKMGHEIHVISALSADSPDYEKNEGVHIHRVSPLNQDDPDFLAWIAGLNLAIAQKALAIARHTKIQVVHTHDWLTGSSAEYISKSLNLPLIATIHGTETGRNGGLFTELQQFIFAKEKELSVSADQLIVCSEFMAKEVSSLFELPEEEIEVIVNGAANYKPELTETNIEDIFPFVKGKKVVFSIGRVVREKGFDTLIKTAASLRDSHPQWCFVIAGNGPLLESYRQNVKKLNLEDTVFFIGFISDDRRLGLLQRCDLAVFPSRYEPFGLAAAEAMAIGAPTIVAKTGGMQNLVENFKTGFLIHPSDENSLANLIKLIAENEQLRKKIGVQGKLFVESKFSWEKNAEKTAATYERLCQYNPADKGGVNENKRSYLLE